MELSLRKRELIDLSELFRDYRVVCNRGRCWLTCEGDSRDLILSAGTEVLINDRAMILTALSDVQLRLEKPEKSLSLVCAFSTS